MVAKGKKIEMSYRTLPATDGTKGREWLVRFKEGNAQVASMLALDEAFKPTLGVVYHLGVIRGTSFPDRERTTGRILAEGGKQALRKAKPEVACLLRDVLSIRDFREMGISTLVVMHEPITDREGEQCLLTVVCDSGGCHLAAHFHEPMTGWPPGTGFVFIERISLKG